MIKKNQTSEDNNVKQHSLPLTLLLHLLPGLLFTAIYFICLPYARKQGIPPLLIFLIVGIFFLIPFELGYLFYLAKKKNRSLSLKSIVKYRKPMPWWQYAVMTVSLVVWAGFIGAAVFPPLQKFIIKTFFFWVPEIYFLQTFISQLDQYSKPLLIIAAAGFVVINGLIGPIVEELYFRGFLLPRISRYGAWAPLINSVLFSLYHFFTPWDNPLRIMAFTPLFYAVWWKKNIYLGMVVHCIMNLLGSVLILSAVLKL